MKSVRKKHLRRGVMVLFLVFAFADLFADTVSPELCFEGIDGFALSGALEISHPTQASNTTAFTTSADSEQERSSGPSNVEENCLFCCGNILPSLHFEVAISDVGRPTADLINSILPTPPPQSLFHPPRIF